MKILIYGAGVIGSLYAVLFSAAGYDTSVYARGKRLQFLQENGLLYCRNGKIARAEPVKILSSTENDGRFDFIFLAVRENQLREALESLKGSQSDIVTLVNSVEDYHEWETVCGEGRIIPAFPGAGGSISDNVLDAELTPALIQPTTFGEISGEKTDRSRKLQNLFLKAGIPCQMVNDMHLWQLCHLAMVVPIADAYYEAGQPERAGYDKELMLKAARQLKRNFCFLKRRNGRLSPLKMNIFRIMPVRMISAVLSTAFRSRFGDKFMYRHAMKAPDEMKELHRQLYAYMEYSS